MKPRIIDFRWYYDAFYHSGLSYNSHAFAIAIAVWFSRTFNLYLITSSLHEPKYKIV